VEFHRQLFQVIRSENEKALLARMIRSAVSNAPVYYIPVNAVYEWQLKSECVEMAGTWENNEFCLE
jgi:hypothetical protein